MDDPRSESRTNQQYATPRWACPVWSDSASRCELTTSKGRSQQRPRKHLHGGWQFATFPKLDGQISGSADQCRSNSTQHGRLEHLAAVRWPRVLGVQLHDELDSPAL